MSYNHLEMIKEDSNTTKSCVPVHWRQCNTYLWQVEIQASQIQMPQLLKIN